MMQSAKPKVLISFVFIEGGGGFFIPLGMACKEALEEFGFDVDTFNAIVEVRRGLLWKTLERLAVTGGRLIGRSKAETKAKLPWLEEAQRFNGIIEKVREYQPDYLFVISTYTYPKHVLDALRQEANIKQTIGWCVEGPTWVGNPNHEAELYDNYFCIHRFNITHPKIQYLPATGFDPANYRRLESREKTHDLVFVGQEKKRRIEWLTPLKNLGLDIYGPKWEKTSLAANHRAVGIFGGDLNELYNRAKIVLNVTAWPNEEMNCLNLRILDVPATGSMLLTDYAPGIEEYLVPDREIVVAHSPEEMLDKARYYLAHEAERERIALAGWERVQKLETYRDKMRHVLQTCKIPLPKDSASA